MTDMPALVSVILPAYQIENYITESIESVLCQSYPHFELVIIDDGSTDRTLQIAQSYAGQDGRLRLIHQSPNQGMVSTYNALLQAARYDWVFLLDGDDRMLPDRLERQMAFLQEHPDLVLMGGWVYYINSRGRRIGRNMYAHVSAEKIRLDLEGDHPFWLHSPTTAFHRPTALKVGGYRDVSPGMDTDLYTRMALFGKVLWQPEFLGEYRIHAKSSSVENLTQQRKVHRWISSYMRARRLGQPEPSLLSFIASENNLPLPARLKLNLLDHSAVYYKRAVVAYSNQGYLQSALFGLISVLLWPPMLVGKMRNRKLF